MKVVIAILAGPVVSQVEMERWGRSMVTWPPTGQSLLAAHTWLVQPWLGATPGPGIQKQALTTGGRGDGTV